MPERSLAELEESILKTVARLQTTIAENEQLKRELQELKLLVEELRVGNQKQQEIISRLNDQRLQVRDRLQRMERFLAVLEGTTPGPSS